MVRVRACQREREWGGGAGEETHAVVKPDELDTRGLFSFLFLFNGVL